MSNDKSSHENAKPSAAGGRTDAKPEGAGPPHVNIQIDREHFKVEANVMTGVELRALPVTPIAADRDLFQVVPGGQDIKVEDDARVQLKSGMRFFTAPGQINPGRS